MDFPDLQFIHVCGPAGTPAVQSLQIEEVHTYKHSNVQFTSCLQPVYSTGRISALLHFYDSKQKRGDRATLLLSSHVCCINRRLYELRGSHKAAPVFCASRKTPCEKKWYKIDCTMVVNSDQSGCCIGGFYITCTMVVNSDQSDCCIGGG